MQAVCRTMIRVVHSHVNFNLLELIFVCAIHPNKIVPRLSFNCKIQGHFPVINESGLDAINCNVVFVVVTALELESAIIIPCLIHALDA